MCASVRIVEINSELGHLCAEIGARYAAQEGVIPSKRGGRYYGKKEQLDNDIPCNQLL